VIVAGLDIGSSTAKAVILKDGKIFHTCFTPTGPNSGETARQVIEVALGESSLQMKNIKYVVSTGYGRINVPFAQKNITEISCHARGTLALFPDVRTILDMGGQDCKVIRCNEQGMVLNFNMNDKCAAGTGRYLERVAATLGISIQEVGGLSMHTVDGPAPISNYCTVFAQRDVVSLLRQGRQINDILAGVCESLTERIQMQIKRAGLVEKFSISGGVAKNIGIVQRLERNLGVKAHIASEPLIIGALGAALFAQELAKKAAKKT